MMVMVKEEERQTCRFPVFFKYAFFIVEMMKHHENSSCVVIVAVGRGVLKGEVDGS